MSEQIPGFRGRSVDDVQDRVFLRDLPMGDGRWPYQKTGLNAPPGTLVLFQFKARIIASGVFLRDEKFDHPRRGRLAKTHNGVLRFAADSFRTFTPLAVADMRKVWPSFRAFGHVKQHLNPTLYSKFKRQLRNVRTGSVIS